MVVTKVFSLQGLKPRGGSLLFKGFSFKLPFISSEFGDLLHKGAKTP